MILPKLVLLWFTVATLLSITGAELTLRLSGGTSYEGRLEVYCEGQWGTVCDDNWDDFYCGLVCDQLGFTGGTLVSADRYGVSTGDILLDDVECHGAETSLEQCDRGFWGTHNCDHNEDVACVCQTPPGAAIPGCDIKRHRLRPWDLATPWLGRVEVKNDLGVWGTVCDDLWRDTEAHVFCTCLGYTDSRYFRALWSPELASLSPDFPMHYDSVACNSAHYATPHDLWGCDTQAATGRCDVRTEAAGVACGPVPQAITPVAPSVQLTCSSNTLTVCFLASNYVMNANFLSLLPLCSSGGSRRNVTGGVCYDIDMLQCAAMELTTDASSKHYCYDVTYSQYDTDPTTLLIDSVWSRRACCSVAKNGSVVSTFGSHITQPSSPVFAQAPTNFTLACYTDKSFTGSPIEFPANVTRGQELYCRVTAHAWDTRLFLVVPECEFRARLDAPPSYAFLMDKCPTTGDLGVSYFSFDTHNWGVQFQTPKFQGYDSLYLACTAYVCDTTLDSKPYCDRSCTHNGSRRRRSVPMTTPPGADHVTKGPFVIQDNGFGPLLTVSSSMHSTHLPAGQSRVHVDVVSHTLRAAVPHSPAQDIDSGQSMSSSRAADDEVDSVIALSSASGVSNVLYTTLSIAILCASIHRLLH